MTLSLLADGVENPANLARIADAARLVGASCSETIAGRLIAVENSAKAREIYGRSPLRGDATLAVGNERRGLSRRMLSRAEEIIAIPTISRTVNTLNVAAAAAVAAWYVLHGSGPQARAANPQTRRPSVLIIGEDHVEVGSTLRSAAAFGFRDVLLEDRGCGWFDGPAAKRREAAAAARRHKNPLRVHRSTCTTTSVFEEIILVLPSGGVRPLQRERLAHGPRQLIVLGSQHEGDPTVPTGRLKVATLGLVPADQPPLRLVASIALAEVARQVGRRAAGRGFPRGLVYERAIPLGAAAETLQIDPSELLTF